MFGGYWQTAWNQLQQQREAELDAAPASSEKPMTPERHKAIVVLNTWAREKSNVIEVLDLIIKDLGLREKWEVPE